MAQQPGSQVPREIGRQNLIDAVDTFSKSLSPQQQHTLSQTENPDNIIELTKALKDAKVSEKKIKRCESFLQSVQQFSGIVDTMIQHSPCISALVWGGVKILLLTAQNYIRFFSSLTDLLEKLGMICPVFKEFQDLWPNYQGLQDAIFQYYAVTVEFCTSALDYLRKSSTSMILRALLQPFQHELQDVEKTLTIQQKIVDYQIILAREGAARKGRQQQMLFNINWEAHREEEVQEWTRNRQWRLRLEANAKGNAEHQLQQWKKVDNKLLQLELKQKAQQNLEERRRLLKQISDYNHTATFLDFAKVSHPRTGEWLFEMSEYREWVQSSCSSVLWCYGIPGSGKSVLSTAVVKHLLDACAQQINSGSRKTFIGYFFCTFFDPRSLNFEEIIRSLIKQILSVFHGSTEFEGNLFRPEIEGYIDASLDQRLKDGRLQVQNPAIVKDIKQALMTGVEGIKINDEEIRKTLRSLPRNLDETYIRILERIIRERNKDIAVEAFQWITMARRRLSLRELVEAVVITDDDRTRMQGLDRIPANLDKVIEACGNLLVIEGPVHDSSIVRFIHSTVVTFLCTYKMPAPLEVFRIEPQATELHLAQRCLQYLHFQDFRAQVALATAESTTTESATAESIPIAKPKRSVLSMPVSNWIPIELQSNWVATAASRYALAQPLEEHVPTQANLKMFNRKGNTDSDAATSHMHKSTLFEYVIEYWLSHCRSLPITCISSTPKNPYLTWFRNLVLNRLDMINLPWASHSSSIADPHHERFKWAVQNSHEALVQLTFQEVSSEGVSSAQYVEAFLCHASVGTKYECHVSEMPLLVAAALGYPYLVDLYLSKGSQLDFEFRLHETGEKQTALMAASARGHLRTVEHILQVGAELDYNPEYLSNALHCACAGGHLSIFDRLVLAGAPVDWSSLLITAANAGQVNSINYILTRENFLPKTLSKALDEAARNGHIKAWKRLQERSVEKDQDELLSPHGISTSRKKANTNVTCSIALAVEFGYQEMAELLVEAYLKQVNEPKGQVDTGKSAASHK
ncbi:hypothetical protein BDZ91DRAFT_783378 [Kalaharituber pfeilii]|nr:hypothetical protein BDZ91DRAFT_783378 [Kalaharituber pfeilii]